MDYCCTFCVQYVFVSVPYLFVLNKSSQSQWWVMRREPDVKPTELPTVCRFLLSSLPPLWLHGFFHAETWSLKALWKTRAEGKRGNFNMIRNEGAHIRVLAPPTSLLLQISFSLRCSSMSGARCFSHWDARFTTRLVLASTWDWRREQNAGWTSGLLRLAECFHRSLLTWSFSKLLSASGSRSIVFFFTLIFSSFSAFSSSLFFSSSNTYQQKDARFYTEAHLSQNIEVGYCSGL